MDERAVIGTDVAMDTARSPAEELLASENDELCTGG